VGAGFASDSGPGRARDSLFLRLLHQLHAQGESQHRHRLDDGGAQFLGSPQQLRQRVHPPPQKQSLTTITSGAIKL